MTLDMASYLWAFITNEIIQNLITYDIDKLRYTYIYITKRITFSDSVILHKLQCHNNTWLLFVDFLHSVQFSLVAQSCLTLWPHESQQARPPCPSPTPGVPLKLMSIESLMPSSHLILCRPLLLLPPILPSIRIFSNESTLPMKWPKYWSFRFSISPSNEHRKLISFRMD